jgi:cysteine desulfurase family protein (TIGR01976 family)
VTASDLDLAHVRSQFPALASGYVFLDNAGGSQTLRAVADRARDYLLTTNVQLGASYEVSVVAGARVSEAVRRTAAYVGTDDPSEIVLGASTTQLVSNLAFAMKRGLSAGDEVIVTSADHEANAGPWKRLVRKGVIVREWRIDRDTQRLEARDLQALLGPKTKLVAFTHVSNLLGSIHDVAGLTRLAHEHGAAVCVDGVAYAPHRAIDVKAWDVDYYVFSFYKVYGPHQAVLYGKRARLDALSCINHEFLADEVPYKLQPGNVNFELSHSLGGFYDYVDALGGRAAAFDAIAAHEERLSRKMLDWLAAQPGIRVFGERTADRALRVPTISFVVDGLSNEAIVREVDRAGIGIRHGDFYARRLVSELGLAESGGVIRVSMVHYNREDEIERLQAALEEGIHAVRRRGLTGSTALPLRVRPTMTSIRFLCVSDIHGNADALHAVLAMAERRGFTRLLAAGDHLFPGPKALATWRLLTATQATCVQGVGDRALAVIDPDAIVPSSPHEKERLDVLRSVRKEVGDLILARLAQLPKSVRIPLPNGSELVLVHGSPRDPTEGLSADLTDEEILALIGDDPADIVVCGSTHVPFDRTVASDLRIVNVGSVGEAPGGELAHATFIDVGSTGVEVEQIAVPYDRT